MSNYSISYGNGHGARSINLSAEGKAEAKDKVRTEAGRMLGGAREDEVVFVSAEDGTYAYLSQGEADADETGASAFAVISRED